MFLIVGSVFIVFVYVIGVGAAACGSVFSFLDKAVSCVVCGLCLSGLHGAVRSAVIVGGAWCVWPVICWVAVGGVLYGRAQR